MSRTPIAAAGALVLAALAIARLVPVYRALSQTYDEPFHIASGMEWLSRGRYTYEAQHPPLARVADASGVYLAGIRLHGRESAWDEGNDILASRGEYWRNLTLARLGALPFFVLACAVIFLWARRWFSLGAAVWGVLLFSVVPPVLASASQATTDMACAATVVFALYEWVRWVERPNWRRSAWLGGAVALAVLSKFSSLPFLGACVLAVLAYFFLFRREWWRKTLAGRAKLLVLAAAVALLLVWAGYLFSFHSISEERGYEKTLVNISAVDSRYGRVLEKISSIPFPMPELFHGLYMVIRHNQAGHDSFLLGEYRDHGWWYFFLVILAIKTPIGFLLLAGAGMAIVIGQMMRRVWQRRLTVCFPIAILLVCMAANLNLGIRHILPIFPLLAVFAGYAAAKSFRNPARWVTAPAAVFLAGWAVADSWLARPDYIAYFNQLTGSHPERITVESDLGQDAYRLAMALKALGVNQVAARLNTTARLDQMGFPPVQDIPAFKKVTGYVAISDWFFEMGYAQNKSYAWLRSYTPLQRIGKTIWLYKIP